MKYHFFLFFLLGNFICLPMFAQRNKQLINFEWKYCVGDMSDAYKIGYDDSNWKFVNLPHDASIAGPFVKDSLNSNERNGYLPRQKGWYRKVLNLNKDINNKKVFLEFEGIYRDARIYVNELEVAHLLNGYESYLVDITEVVHIGDNQIAVKYDNTYKQSSRWYNGEGIYRDVWLITTDKIHVDYNGTYIHTPFVTSEIASVQVQTEICNETNVETDVTVISEIYSPAGNKVCKITDVAPIFPGETYVFNQCEKILTPILWDIESPNLYRIITYVKTGDEVRDCYHSTFGIRTIEFDRDKGLLLNGRKVLVKGVNMHHDLGPLGAAAFSRGYERRLSGFKKLGCNAIRLSHNPHSKYVLDWCDKNGVLVFDEAFDKWSNQYFGKENKFRDYWKASLTSFIKRDRNHPSVFVWSVGNEVAQQKNGEDNFGADLLKEMVDYVRALEPSRKVTAGLFPARRYGTLKEKKNFFREGPPEMEFYSDVVSVNYREEFWPLDKAKYPQLIFMLSEAQVSNLGNEWFNFDHDSSIGLFYWGGTDYIGESFGWPAKGWVNGIIYWTDEWKPFSYYIQSLYDDKPRVHLAVVEEKNETTQYWNEVNLKFQPMFSHWNWNGKDTVTISSFSNCQVVELYLNGKLLGKKQIPEVYYTKKIKGYAAEEFNFDSPIETGPELHKQLEWKVPYEPGTIEAVGYVDGQKVAYHKMVTAGKPYRIVLETDKNTIQADGMDLAYITAKIVDRSGTIVPDAMHAITFKVDGSGDNIAVGSANMTSDESFVSNRRYAFEGKALLIVRSRRQQGNIRISAVSPGLKSAKMEIFSREIH